MNLSKSEVFLLCAPWISNIHKKYVNCCVKHNRPPVNKATSLLCAHLRATWPTPNANPCSGRYRSCMEGLQAFMWTLQNKHAYIHSQSPPYHPSFTPASLTKNSVLNAPKTKPGAKTNSSPTQIVATVPGSTRNPPPPPRPPPPPPNTINGQVARLRLVLLPASVRICGLPSKAVRLKDPATWAPIGSLLPTPVRPLLCSTAGESAGTTNPKLGSTAAAAMHAARPFVLRMARRRWPLTHTKKMVFCCLPVPQAEPGAGGGGRVVQYHPGGKKGRK